MVLPPVVEGVQVTWQVEVLGVAMASVHGLPTTAGVDAVKAAVP
jgi:hypothetical protein